MIILKKERRLSVISYQLSNLFSAHKTSSLRRNRRRDLTARCYTCPCDGGSNES